MIYSDFYFKEKVKIPTFLGIFVIFLSIFLFFSFLNGSATSSRASKLNLKRVEIVNLKPIQTNIFWQTTEKETGWVIYGEEENRLDKITYDERDTFENKGKYYNHYVTLRDLKPGKKHYFAIVSSEKKIIKDGDKYFNFITPETLSNLTKLNPASGKILKANLSPLSDGFVILTVNKDTFPLVTTIKNGEWLISLNSFIDKNTFTEKSFTGKEKAMVEIINEDNQKTTIINTLDGLSQKTETVIIGKDYNFLEDNVLSATDYFNNNQEKNKIEIVYPQENSLIPGRRPLIKGFAIPNSTIYITINSKKTFSAFVNVDKNGNWNYLIPEDLEIGDHIITIKTKNEKGEEISLTRKFKIIGNSNFEGKVLGTASGEPTITIYRPTYSPTPSSVINYITKIPITISPSLPKSGVSEFIPFFGGLSLTILGIGILLVF